MILTKQPSNMGLAVTRAAGFKLPVYPSKERLYEKYTDFCDGYGEVTESLMRVADRHLGINVQLPPAPVLGLEIAELSYDEATQVITDTVARLGHQIREAFVAARIGTVEFGQDGESCQFTFQEVHQRRGLIRHTVSRTRHTHTLVRTKMRRLDDRDVKLPRAAAAIVRDLNPRVHDQLRVVMGTEVVREVGETEIRRSLSPLAQAVGKTAKGAAGKAVELAPAATAGAAVIGLASLGWWAVTAAAAPAAVFLADPALVLGDVCLYGWED